VGFAYLEFSWTHSPFVFSSIQPYPQLQSFSLFRVRMGSAPPVSGCACHTLATVTNLVLSKHTGGGGATPAFSGCLVYLQFMWGSVPSPCSGGAFHMTATVTSFPLSKAAGQVLPLLPSPAGLFIYSSCGKCSYPTLQIWGCPSLFTLCLFFQLLVYYSVSFFCFSPGWWSVCLGGYADLAQGCLWEYCMPLSSPGCLLLPSRLGAGLWWHRSSPGFSIWWGVGMLCRVGGVEDTYISLKLITVKRTIWTWH
jgi:hypothetical protein